MRALFTCAAGSWQHLNCLLPLARAGRDRGDTVAIASGPDRRDAVLGAGFEFIPVGLAFADQIRACSTRFPDFRLGGAGEELLTLTQFFGQVAASATCPDLIRAAQLFAPDLIVHEPAELAAPLAARVVGVAHATHAWGLPIPSIYARAIAAAVAPMWEGHGLEVPRYGGLCEHASIEICPPSLREERSVSYAPLVQQLRPQATTGPWGDGDEAGLDALPARPLVHISLGTAAFNQVRVLLAMILEALRELKVNVVVSVGPGNDRHGVGVVPTNALVTEFVPHALLMPRCDVVITHGGSGTVLSALEHAVPLLVIPLGADQFRMAAAVVNSGAGLALTSTVDPPAIAAAVTTLLSEGQLRARAVAISREIAAMPAPEDAWPDLVAAMTSGTN